MALSIRVKICKSYSFHDRLTAVRMSRSNSCGSVDIEPQRAVPGVQALAKPPAGMHPQVSDEGHELRAGGEIRVRKAVNFGFFFGNQNDRQLRGELQGRPRILLDERQKLLPVVNPDLMDIPS